MGVSGLGGKCRMEEVFVLVWSWASEAWTCNYGLFGLGRDVETILCSNRFTRV